VNGDAGNDSLHTGSENDIASGRLGDDYLYGDFGDDFLVGNEGFDTADGDYGTDECDAEIEQECESRTRRQAV
jgi:Ca2+-binding RTX toxin-like protein